jgi:BASS family bile acid:Na+ symporter
LRRVPADRGPNFLSETLEAPSVRLNDIILFAVVFGSIIVAVLAPGLGTSFQPLLLYFMMALLFLSFLRIDFTALMDISRAGISRLVLLVSVKQFLLPAALYFIVGAILPDFAIPVLLVSGISTGVVAPFIALLLSADLVLVLRLVVITSVMVPFSLPCLVKALAGAEIVIPLGVMVKLLSTVVLVPMVVVIILKRLNPALIESIVKRQFPLSLALFAVINLAVFSKYSRFFLDNPSQIGLAVVVAYGLAVIFYFVGYIIFPGRSMPERLAAGVSLAAMNNVLVIMFASEFFGPLSPTLAAVYMFPYYTMIVPVKMLAGWASKKNSELEEKRRSER